MILDMIYFLHNHIELYDYFGLFCLAVTVSCSVAYSSDVQNAAPRLSAILLLLQCGPYSILRNLKHIYMKFDE
jgi:hypothetical protein